MKNDDVASKTVKRYIIFQVHETGLKFIYDALEGKIVDVDNGPRLDEKTKASYEAELQKMYQVIYY